MKKSITLKMAFILLALLFALLLMFQKYKSPAVKKSLEDVANAAVFDTNSKVPLLIDNNRSQVPTK